MKFEGCCHDVRDATDARFRWLDLLNRGIIAQTRDERSTISVAHTEADIDHPAAFANIAPRLTREGSANRIERENIEHARLCAKAQSKRIGLSQKQDACSIAL
jgi:hypothetical protein